MSSIIHHKITVSYDINGWLKFNSAIMKNHKNCHGALITDFRVKISFTGPHNYQKSQKWLLLYLIFVKNLNRYHFNQVLNKFRWPTKNTSEINTQKLIHFHNFLIKYASEVRSLYEHNLSRKWYEFFKSLHFILTDPGTLTCKIRVFPYWHKYGNVCKKVSNNILAKKLPLWIEPGTSYVLLYCLPEWGNLALALPVRPSRSFVVMHHLGPKVNWCTKMWS